MCPFFNPNHQNINLQGAWEGSASQQKTAKLKTTRGQPRDCLDLFSYWDNGQNDRTSSVTEAQLTRFYTDRGYEIPDKLLAKVQQKTPNPTPTPTPQPKRNRRQKGKAKVSTQLIFAVLIAE